MNLWGVENEVDSRAGVSRLFTIFVTSLAYPLSGKMFSLFVVRLSILFIAGPAGGGHALQPV